MMRRWSKSWTTCYRRKILTSSVTMKCHGLVCAVEISLDVLVNLRQWKGLLSQEALFFFLLISLERNFKPSIIFFDVTTAAPFALSVT